MNTIVADVQSAYNLLNARRVGDTNFYLNSLYLVNDYNKVNQFNVLGVNSKYLINTLNIGTDKLKNNLQTSTLTPTIVNSTTNTSVTASANATYSSSSGLSPTGVTPGNYSTPTNLTVDAYGRITSLSSGGGGPISAATANTANSANSFSSGFWTITQSGTKLNFTYNGLVVMSLDSTGNVIMRADMTAFGTP
jgi:hypothetical protein